MSILLKRRIVTSVLLMALSLVAHGPVSAGDINVNTTCSLADAITAANTDRATGGCPAGDGADTIQLTGDITLEASLPNITSEIRIIGGEHFISGDRKFRIFFIESEGSLTLQDVTLIDGRADAIKLFDWEEGIEVGGAIINLDKLSISGSILAFNMAEYGGAIYSGEDGELHINDSDFAENVAAKSGGAIYNSEDSELSISDSGFIENVAANSGGAIRNLGELSISDSSFADNVASVGGGAIYNGGELSISNTSLIANNADSGGAIYNSEDSELSISGGSFAENVASVGGGAIRNSGELNISNTILSENIAGLGGAIYNSEDSELSISDSSFADNVASVGGGAIYNGGELNISNSIYEANRAESGGAIHNYGDAAEMSINNSVFTQNRAFTFGGAVQNDSKINVSQSTFAENSAYYGGAIHNYGDAADMRISSSYFNQNIATFGGVVYSTGVTSISNSIFAENWADIGGALSNKDGGEMSARNSSFADNLADYHSGAIDNEGVLGISGSIFLRNSPDDCSGYSCASVAGGGAEQPVGAQPWED